MKNEFDRRLKNIEQELTDLKTAGEYTSVKSAEYTYGTLVSTGVYRITYETRPEAIFSIIYGSVSGSDVAIVEPRTPTSNHQIVDVVTTYYDGNGYVTKQVPLSIISNRAVTDVERIS